MKPAPPCLYSTPHAFRRQRFTLLPFGLVVLQDVFQKHLDSALEDLKRFTGIADVTFVYCEASEEEHDANMANLSDPGREESNSTKTKCTLNVRKLASLDTKGPGKELNRMTVISLQFRR